MPKESNKRKYSLNKLLNFKDKKQELGGLELKGNILSHLLSFCPFSVDQDCSQLR